jgi:hypothetical protein
MYFAQSKAIILIGATILLITTATLLWNQPDYTNKLGSLHLSTTQTRPVTFQQRSKYFDLSEAGDGNWTSLLPPNGGFVSSPSREGPGYEMVGITMFHQLHCLQMIRSTIQDLMAGRPVGSRMNERMENEMFQAKQGHPYLDDSFGVRKRHGPHLDQEHWVHCLDYLMQGILCAADDTIEFAHEDDEGARTVDGYEVTHQCRSADSIWEKVMGKQSTPGWRPVTELKQRSDGVA